MVTLSAKGIPSASKTNFCSTLTARNSRAAAPSNRDSTKKVDPIFCPAGPRRSWRKL